MAPFPYMVIGQGTTEVKREARRKEFELLGLWGSRALRTKRLSRASSGGEQAM